MGTNTFDTNRFVETTNPRQFDNGTIMFMDVQNPGVYYTAHRNGNLNRIIKTNVQTILTNENMTTQTITRKMTRYTRINYRQPNNGAFVPLHRLNDQLRRIQQVAQSYDASESTMGYYQSNDQTIIVTPR